MSSLLCRMQVLGLALAGLGMGGCAEIHRSQLRTSDEVVGVEERTVASADVNARMKVEGSVLTIDIARRCSTVEMERVEHTVVSDQDLDDGDEVWMAFLGIGGLAPLGGGIGMLVDSPNVYPSNVHARFYNPTGQVDAIGLGVVLVLVGTAMVIPPFVNAVRAVGDHEETSTTERQGRVLQREARCLGGETFPGVTVYGRTPQGSVALSATMASDRWVVDLTQALPPSFFQTMPPPVSLGIWVNEKYVGEVDVTPLTEAFLRRQADQDELAWRTAEPDACQRERTPSSCAGVVRYVGALPSGRHADDGRRLLERLVPDAPTVAIDPGQVRLDRARAAAADAVALAEQKIVEKAEADGVAAQQRLEAELAKARQKVCSDTCAKACEKDADCRTQCSQELCQ